MCVCVCVLQELRCTALHEAAALGHYEVVEVLVVAGADLKVGEGRTVKHGGKVREEGRTGKEGGRRRS